MKTTTTLLLILSLSFPLTESTGEPSTEEKMVAIIERIGGTTDDIQDLKDLRRTEIKELIAYTKLEPFKRSLMHFSKSTTVEILDYKSDYTVSKQTTITDAATRLEHFYDFLLSEIGDRQDQSFSFNDKGHPQRTTSFVTDLGPEIGVKSEIDGSKVILDIYDYKITWKSVFGIDTEWYITPEDFSKIKILLKKVKRR